MPSIPSSWPEVPPGVVLIRDAPVYSIPFSRKRLSCGRRPETENMLPTEEFEVPVLPERWLVQLTVTGFSSSNWS